MSRLEHPNVVELIGQCEDLSVITELADGGNIRDFIHAHQAELSYECLLRMCTGLAAGMKYLEQEGIVHGHLSPRTCLVDSSLCVRISAARGPNHHAQLRYSAPEAIILNTWSTKSDAWSFGVLGWEILHRCNVVPFEVLTNNEIIDNAQRMLQGVESAAHLVFEETCPRETADLLRECCAAEADTRPNFLEIHLFLMRKNLGFTLQQNISMLNTAG
ncbi:TK/DDR protein kinase [Aphelenchoides avenae]|nr:TK/DDR protein kinase [Aphelenchus avenae]